MRMAIVSDKREVFHQNTTFSIHENFSLFANFNQNQNRLTFESIPSQFRDVFRIVYFLSPNVNKIIEGNLVLLNFPFKIVNEISHKLLLFIGLVNTSLENQYESLKEIDSTCGNSHTFLQIPRMKKFFSHFYIDLAFIKTILHNCLLMKNETQNVEGVGLLKLGIETTFRPFLSGAHLEYLSKLFDLCFGFDAKTNLIGPSPSFTKQGFAQTLKRYCEINSIQSGEYLEEMVFNLFCQLNHRKRAIVTGKASKGKSTLIKICAFLMSEMKSNFEGGGGS